MTLSSIRPGARRAAITVAVFALVGYRVSTHTCAQSGPRNTATPQKLDDDYTARIKKATPDARILTELVDHMPASATVASPLKFLGYVPGEPGHMTYHTDIVRYYEALENPTPAGIMWGPRANVNMQQSAILISMNNVARNHETFLENYYLKNKHTIERGQAKAPYAYVIPAAQRRRVEAAELMNLIGREGAEVHTANAAFTAGTVTVAAGDYIVRLDQPYGAIVETLLGVQFYPPENPRAGRRRGTSSSASTRS